jgi:hypothetical protein
MKDDYRTYMPFDPDRIYDCEVYDYEEDPLETVNLYRSEAHKEIVDHLMTLFTEFVGKQNDELKSAGSNPENRLSSGPGELKIDKNFDRPLDEAWNTFSRNGAKADFSIVDGSGIGDKTLQVEVTNTGKNPWDIGIESNESTELKAGAQVHASFSARGKQIKVVLFADPETNVSQSLEPGQSTYLQNITFEVPSDGSYTLRFLFQDKGTYLLDNIKTEIL